MLKNLALTALAFGALWLADSSLLGDEIGWRAAIVVALPLYAFVVFLAALMAAPARMDLEVGMDRAAERRAWGEERSSLEKQLAEKDVELARIRGGERRVFLGAISSEETLFLLMVGVAGGADKPADEYLVTLAGVAGSMAVGKTPLPKDLAWTNRRGREARTIAPGMMDTVEFCEVSFSPPGESNDRSPCFNLKPSVLDTEWLCYPLGWDGDKYANEVPLRVVVQTRTGRLDRYLVTFVPEWHPTGDDNIVEAKLEVRCDPSAGHRRGPARAYARGTFTEAPPGERAVLLGAGLSEWKEQWLKLAKGE